MGWLVGYTLGSAVLAFLAVRLFDWLVSGATGGIARAAVFITVWTACTAKLAMRSVSAQAHQLRQGGAALRDRLTASVKPK